MHASSVTTHHKTIGPVLKPSQLGNRWLSACSFDTILSSHLLPRIQEVKFNLFVCVGWKFTSSKYKGQIRWTPQAAWWHIRLRIGDWPCTRNPALLDSLKNKERCTSPNQRIIRQWNTASQNVQDPALIQQETFGSKTPWNFHNEYFRQVLHRTSFWDKLLLFAKRLCCTYYVGTL